MADDKSNTDGGDRKRVAGNQGYEVSYFARKHNLSSTDARALIERFGNNRGKLNAEAEKLAKNGPSNRHRKSPPTGVSNNRTSQTGSPRKTGTTSTSRIANAAAVGGVVAAGALLWSRRTAVGGQISKLSDQMSDWRQPSEAGDGQTTQSKRSKAQLQKSSSGRSQVEIAEEALTLKELGATPSE